MSRLSGNNSGASPPYGEESPNLRRIVLVGCAIAIVLFIAAVGVLYSGWFGQENPSGLIVVQGESSIADALVTIRPIDNQTRAPLQAQFKNGIDNRVRFHVPQGRYEINVRGEGVSFNAQAVDVFAYPVIVQVFGSHTTSRPAGNAVKRDRS